MELHLPMRQCQDNRYQQENDFSRCVCKDNAHSQNWTVGDLQMVQYDGVDIRSTCQRLTAACNLDVIVIAPNKKSVNADMMITGTAKSRCGPLNKRTIQKIDEVPLQIAQNCTLIMRGVTISTFQG